MKTLLLAALCTCAAPGVLAMDQATLLASPERYLVVYADEAERVYADRETLTRRPFQGGEVIAFTMYAETYKYRPGTADYREDTLVANIQRWDALLTADTDAKTYRLEKRLRDVWDRDGSRIGGSAWCGPLSLAPGEAIYINLRRTAEAAARQRGAT